MALYRPNYWNNYPEPFYPDWQQEPIPGWGARPVMAGPARVGVGAISLAKEQKLSAHITMAKIKPSKLVRMPQFVASSKAADEGAPAPSSEPSSGLRWLVAGALVLSVGGVGFYRGWKGKR